MCALFDRGLPDILTNDKEDQSFLYAELTPNILGSFLLGVLDSVSTQSPKVALYLVIFFLSFVKRKRVDAQAFRRFDIRHSCAL